jgi:hypothetical protein
MDKNSKVPRASAQANEGEGNRTAARAYNQQAERFAKSGKVEQKAREAQHAVDGAEGQDLARAAAIGASHNADTHAGTTHAVAIAAPAIDALSLGATAMINSLNGHGFAFAQALPEQAQALTDAGNMWLQWPAQLAQHVTSSAASEVAVATQAMAAMAACRTPTELFAMQGSLVTAWFARALSQSIALSALAMAPLQHAGASATDPGPRRGANTPR